LKAVRARESSAGNPSDGATPCHGAAVMRPGRVVASVGGAGPRRHGLHRPSMFAQPRGELASGLRARQHHDRRIGG